MQARKILIGGEWCEASERMTVRNPFTNEVIAEVFQAKRDEMERVFSSAGTGASEMRRLARFQIAKGLRKIAEGIEARKKDFVKTIAEESAKPVIYARSEVERAVATFLYAAGEAERFVGEMVAVDAQAVGKDKTAWTKRVPRGVIYGITPFNFPLNLVAHKVAPALAAGNSIIIKPSEKTPLTALLLGEVFLDSGLPKNALQIVPMDVGNMDLVFDDERIKMISFTGSAEVGWKLKSLAGKKAVALELGGNAPVIIDESADLEKTVEKNVVGAFAFSGQICISVQRIFIHEKIFADWTEKFITATRQLRKGNPLDEKTQISVMIDEKAARRTEKWVAEAVENGARLLTGGKREKAFFEPTVLTGTTAEMRVVSEEVFAPIVVIEKFTDFEEAINLANNSKYGLQAGVFTQNLKNANYAAENLDFGGVIINDLPIFRVDNMPYGGVKNSGFGREGVRYAMEEMSEIRLIVINS
jgi:glyceraldehyde-3-phosphate dehydrogenase (NADP+)